MFTPQKLLELITRTDPAIKGKLVNNYFRCCCIGRVARNDGTKKFWTIHTIKVNGVVYDVVVADGIIL